MEVSSNCYIRAFMLWNFFIRVQEELVAQTL